MADVYSKYETALDLDQYCDPRIYSFDKTLEDIPMP